MLTAKFTRLVSYGMTIGALVSAEPPVARAAIFGEDNRNDLTVESPVYQLGRATAVAVISTNRVTQPDGRLSIMTEPLTATTGFCADERFALQQSLSLSCSGFLIAPDLLVTAGHCQTNVDEVRNNSGGYCEVFSWLFDYQMSPQGELKTTDIPPERLYNCKQIIYAVADQHEPFRDFAIVQLDRPVLDREPLKIAELPISLGDSVTMIGYPTGLPMKLTDRARVTFNDPSTMAFVTNLDALDGNSGSAVLNSKGEIAGILVSGTPSRRSWLDTTKQCERVNRCDDDGKNCILPDEDPKKVQPSFQAIGSDVQRIQPVLGVLKSMGVKGF